MKTYIIEHSTTFLVSAESAEHAAYLVKSDSDQIDQTGSDFYELESLETLTRQLHLDIN